MDFRRLTRSAAVAADQRSLISSRKSTASSVKASEMRLTAATKISEAEGALERISNTLQVAEMDLGIHQDEIRDLQVELDEADRGSNEYRLLKKKMDSLKKEEREFLRCVGKMKIDQIFANQELERQKKLGKVYEKHAERLSNLDSDDEQNLSGEDVGGRWWSRSDNESESGKSDDTHTKMMRERLRHLRGSPPPPTTKPEVESSPEVEVVQPAVEQLAQALSQVLGKINNPTQSPTSTGDKMLARQAMKMELSPFDGNPAEWPVFKQQYHTVSKACGFTNVENLHRLQRSLKGEARAAVNALLMAPENVDKILSVLEKRFGNPEKIIEEMEQQVKKIPAVKEGDYGGILRLVDAVRNLAETAKTMNCQPYLANPQLLKCLVSKLPPQFQVKWGEKRGELGKLYPNLEDLAEWMETVGDSVVHLHRTNGNPAPSPEVKKISHQPPSGSKQRSHAVSDCKKKDVEKKCRMCRGNHHHLSKCEEFRRLEVEERWKWVRSNRYCFACLNWGHGLNECRGKSTCGVAGCEKTHHRLLHVQQVAERQSAAPAQPPPPEPPSAAAPPQSSGHVISGQVNLNILPVMLSGPKGSMKTFALLDPGATFSSIEASVADQLGIKGPNVPLVHSGLHASTTVQSSRVVEVTVRGDGDSFKLDNVRTVPSLTFHRQSVKRTTLKKWKHLSSLPIATYEDGKPTILIGNDNPLLANTGELVVGRGNAPAAGWTPLGWVLSGRVGGAQRETKVSHHLREETEDDLHQLVKYHFSTEAFGVKPNVEKPRSREDVRAQGILDSTLTRVGGKWECGLLWREDEPHLPQNSKMTALKRLYTMEKKMDSSPEFAAAYKEKISAYIEKGYARKLSVEESSVVSPKTYYLPHFMAVNPKKANKLRFVFDAAAKTSGRSLNDCLIPGPDLLKSLPSVLFKFREKQVAVTADVRDMFHRVAVKTEDAAAQRFLWRGMDRSKEPETFQMDVLIFGATCSPTIAQAAKNKSAEFFASKYPQTSEAVINNFYVDDYLDSLDSVDQAVQRWEEMREVMDYGNFDLRGVLSNSSEFMEAVPADLRGDTAKKIECGDGAATERVLGLFWRPVEDAFTFSLNFIKLKEEVMTGSRLPTKRELLAIVMSIFDALGLLSLFTIRGKMLLQDCWRSKIGWDDELPESLRIKWEMWKQSLQKIPEFSLRRCYSNWFTSATNITLHVFGDGSEQAYGAVAYFVVEYEGGREVVLVSSKARVAPLKALSIPRMELQAAVLGARLAQFIGENHTVAISRRVFWSDSQTVLSWLESDSRKFQQFVSHRIGEIQELTNPSEWRWVPTKENVADEMTRDCEECDFSIGSRWICGPSFLMEDEEKWPEQKAVRRPAEISSEMKSEFVGVAVESPTAAILNAENFSSWTRLIRVTALVLKFLQKLRRKKTTNTITTEDLCKAEEVWWKTVQGDCYGEERRMLDQKNEIPRESSVRHLQLYLDENGVLRLQGRLHNASVSGDTKNPVLLGPKHPYTRLMLSHQHEKAGHHGMEKVVNELRQRYHIPTLRAAVKSSWNRCQDCSNRRAQPEPPLMGQLPAHRLEASVFPFANTGVDYFGPLEITVGRRREKRWVALFTCLSTRAVHLEIAGSLSTDSCIMAIRRFVGRRGCPKNLYSDNGTNFVGANNELRRALEELNLEKIGSECAVKGIDWHFNPPSAPHMGGSWERLVRSVKVALQTTLREQAPREDVLYTLLVEAEHCVNSHPLTHVSIDPDDEEALTPNHFLIGRSSNVAPVSVCVGSDMWGRKMWRKAQRLADCFWSRWIREYLPTLQRRQKWKKMTKPVEIGDIGVEVDPQQPRNKWKLGKVTAVFPGADGIVRVVEWKTSGGSYRRPVAKIAFLDVRRDKEPTPFEADNAAASSGVGECRRQHQVKKCIPLPR